MLTIVMLPGMHGTGALFAPLIAELGTGFNSVTVSYPPIEGLGYAALAEIARRSLPSEGKFIILGESFSGPIAVMLASAKPAGLVGMILCSTFISNPRPRLKWLRFLAGLAPVKLTPAFIYNFFLLGGAATPSLQSAIRDVLSQISGAALKVRMRAVLDVDVSAHMTLVRVPVLYLRARQDRLVPPNASSRITEMHPETQVVPVDAPHCLLQVAPAEAARIIKQFASQVTQLRYS